MVEVSILRLFAAFFFALLFVTYLYLRVNAKIAENISKINENIEKVNAKTAEDISKIIVNIGKVNAKTAEDISKIIADIEKINARTAEDISKINANTEKVNARTAEDISKINANIEKINARTAEDISNINANIREINLKAPALNLYLNDLIGKLDFLLQKPNDMFIFARKKNKYLRNIINIKTTEEKSDEPFNELLELLDFRDRESNIKIQSKFVNYFKDCEMVLDIGCGKGDFLELCATNNINTLGIDTSQTAIDDCLKRELNVIKADVFQFLSETEMEFDGVFCSHLVEHFTPKNVAELFILLNTRLKDNGKLLIVTPNVESFETQTIHFWRDLTHIRFYQKDVLTRMLELIGFEIIEAKYDEDTKGAKLFDPKWVV